MTEQLLKELESLIGTDDFEYDSEEIMEKLEDEGAGMDAIEALLAMMERHPADDLGMPGAVVHFIERSYPKYIPMLISSIERKPALQTVWMLNRIINGSDEKEKYLAILKNVSENASAETAVRELAISFLEFQSDR